MTAPLPQPENSASHLGVYAFITDRAGANLLVIRKGLGCYTGLYDLPGGTMDPLETLEETLIRETLEETCCTITSYQQLGAFSLLYPFLKDGRDFILRHIGVIYSAEIEGNPTAKPAGGDSLGCVWMPFDELNVQNAAPLVLQALAAWRARHK
jgi:ADP-ribose pyrophosphatase YjhB (NUDIX family)